MPIAIPPMLDRRRRGARMDLVARVIDARLMGRMGDEEIRAVVEQTLDELRAVEEM